MARRDVLAVAGALALGALIGAAISLLYGRGQIIDELVAVLLAEGRWLAAAWGLAALARGRGAAPVAGGLFVAALLVTAELVPPEGVEASARGAGLPPDDARSVAAGFDQGDGGVDAVLIAAGLLMGAGAALWRYGSRWPRAAGVALLAGALLRDLLTNELLVLPVLQVLLAFYLVRRLAPPASRLAALGAAVLVAAALLALPEYGLLHPEVQVIR